MTWKRINMFTQNTVRSHFCDLKLLLSISVGRRTKPVQHDEKRNEILIVRLFDLTKYLLLILYFHTTEASKIIMHKKMNNTLLIN